MNKTNNLRAYLRDLYEGIVSKKPDASRNPQNFRSEIEAIRTGGELYEVMDASELPEDAPNGSLALVEGEPIPEAYTVSSVDELPSDAVDGSMAIVESGGFVGEWKWVATYLDFSMFNKEKDDNSLVFIKGYDDLVGWFDGFYCSVIEGDFSIYFIQNYEKEDGYYDSTLLYSGLEYDDSYSHFTIFGAITKIDGSLVTIDTFREFIGSNCERLSGSGKTLYLRENGEWVYKGEVA